MSGLKEVEGTIGLKQTNRPYVQSNCEKYPITKSEHDAHQQGGKKDGGYTIRMGHLKARNGIYEEQAKRNDGNNYVFPEYNYVLSSRDTRAPQRGMFEKVFHIVDSIYNKITMFIDHTINILKNTAIIISIGVMVRLGFINAYNYFKGKGSKIRYNEFALSTGITFLTDLVCGNVLTFTFVYTKAILFIYLVNLCFNFLLITSSNKNAEESIGSLNGSMIFNTIYNSMFQQPDIGKNKVSNDSSKKNSDAHENNSMSNVIHRVFGSFLF